MSPYVRKTVAHALPKLYQLAPKEKESLLEILEQLLHDRTTVCLRMMYVMCVKCDMSECDVCV